MGNFTVEVKAVGGHGCQREIKDGGTVGDCGNPGCPDCLARRFVADLKKQGQSVETAFLTHWPGQESQVIDNERSGSFA